MFTTTATAEVGVAAERPRPYLTDVTDVTDVTEVTPVELVDLDEALEGLQAALDRVAAAAVDAVDDRELLAATARAEQLGNRLDGLRLGLLGEVDRRGAFREHACVSAGSWLAHTARMDPPVARRRERAAKRLRYLPQVQAARSLK